MEFLQFLYKDQKWSHYCPLLAVISSALIYYYSPSMSELLLLVWMQFVVYLIHQTEEHFWPGGFRDFVNKHIFKSNSKGQPLTDFAVFWINIPIVWFAFPLCAYLAQTVSIAYGLFLPVFGFFNAVLHCLAGIRFACYNPGLIVNIFLQIPTSGYTLYVFYKTNYITYQAGILAFVATFVLHLAMVLYVFSHKKEPQH